MDSSAAAEKAAMDAMTEEERIAYKEQKKLAKDKEKAAKKAEKEARKAAAAAAAAAASAPLQPVTYRGGGEPAPTQMYGDYAVIQSSTPPAGSGRTFVRVDGLRMEAVDEEGMVWVRGRVHTLRAVGRNVFLVLRQSTSTVQAVLAEGGGTSKAFVKWASKELPVETIVDVHARLSPAEVKSCTQGDVELSVVRLYVVSRAAPTPFSLEDAARGEPTSADDVLPRVGRDTRLDGRVVDLRVPPHQALLRVQSAVSGLFREFLTARGFVEIHSPKLIGGASEGGADVFTLDYFGRPACLAQSPQLYKQMAICGDMERVFEVGPVFRAENSQTHRHLCEFTGLDFEMQITEHYSEVLDCLDALFVSIFDGINERCTKELEVIGVKSPFEPFVYSPAGTNLRLEYPMAVAMLREAGVEQDDFDDLSTEVERKLGELVKAKYNYRLFHPDPLPIRSAALLHDARGGGRPLQQLL
eukprot:TRINITY_DN3011_c0_g1_i7.p1 TRINITY_DN3011_c0_g1~~TRINITY_DN3011_c0_g1_i7.p1  ORF type:complete len:490 (-),score=173.13 TRINITY_DN3011_c0_g1_i7:1397-2806(-)